MVLKTSKRLIQILVETGDIFYENHNTGEKIYNFFIAEENDQAAFVPKKFSYRNGFEAYISQYLRAFSIDNVEKNDLYAHKDAKYLFYLFNEYVKAYGSHRRKIRHTRKFKDSVGMQKLEEKNK